MAATPATPKTREAKPWEAEFLEELAGACNVSQASLRVGIDRATAYRHRNACPEFAELWDDAIDDGVDRLAREARRRAMEGTRRGVWYQGERVGEELEYSDVLLMFLLKAHRPEVYRDGYDVGKALEALKKGG